MASIRGRTRKDGSRVWQVLWRDADTGRQTSETYDSEQEAQLLRKFLTANGNSFRMAATAARAMRSTSPTVAHVVTAHIDGLTAVEPGTRAKYRRIADRHIIPALGARPVDTLTRADVAAWFNALDMAPKTRKNVHALLSAALTTAVREKLLEGNPAKGIRGPRSAPRREPVFLTRAEVETIAGTVAPPYGALVRFLADSGLRYAEATALTGAHVARRDGRIVVHVRQAWKRTGAGEALGTPKSPRSRRDVTLSPAASARLEHHLTGRARGGFIFARAGGGHLRNGAFHELYWGPAMAELDGQGLLRARPVPHDLRHTHASWLLAAGVPIHVVSARLGHESITTTVGTYGHLLADADQAAADALD